MLIFNDVNLEDYIIVDDKVQVDVIAERSNVFLEIPSRNGDIYTGHRYGQRKITIPFFIKAISTVNYLNIVKTLNTILNTDVPCKIYLPNELDKYYYAILDSFECEELYIGVGKGEIVFTCSDPYKYSDELKLLTPDNSNIFTVNNGGSEKTYPTINIKFSKDAHFAQIMNWDGESILVGDRPSVEVGSSKPSNTILTDVCESTADWLSAGNVVDEDRIVDGNLGVSRNGEYIMCSNFGNYPEGKWHGAAGRRNIGENITDFELKATMIFKPKFGGKSRSTGNTEVENIFGRAEMYGFDINGQKLFKFVLRDSTYWYDYVEPEIFIGNQLVLDDGKNCPSPKKKSVKEDGKTVSKNIESGAYGDWNNFYGEFYIKRETINNKQYWTAKIDKISGGKVVRTMKTKSRINNSKYPKGDLNHVVIWFGQHKDLPVPEEMGLTWLRIYKLNDVPEGNNVLCFEEGDELEINCSKNEILLNGFNCIDRVDIGSRFFGCDTGESQFVCKTDDENAVVTATIRERWL